PDGEASRLERAPVRCLHGAWSTAGDHRIPGLGESLADLDGQLVDGIMRVGAGRAEDAHGWTELGQGTEALDELALDAQHPPGVGVQPLGPAPGVQEALVVRALGDLGTTFEDRSGP